MKNKIYGYARVSSIHQDYTQIEYRVIGNMNFVKVNAKDPNEAIQGIKFRLTGKSLYGTEYSLEAVSGEDGSFSFKNIEEGDYELQEIEGSYDWIEDHTVKHVHVNSNGKVSVEELNEKNGKFLIPNSPRVHGDIEFQKKSVPTQSEDEYRVNIPGAKFLLSGTSVYGTDYSLIAESNSIGLVSYANIEKGSYSLREISAPSDYVKSNEIWTVQIDDNGYGSIVKGTVFSNNGRQFVENEIRADLYVKKVDEKDLGKELAGAEFTLIGTSDSGNRVSMYRTGTSVM